MVTPALGTMRILILGWALVGEALAPEPTSPRLVWGDLDGVVLEEVADLPAMEELLDRVVDCVDWEPRSRRLI